VQPHLRESEAARTVIDLGLYCLALSVVAATLSTLVGLVMSDSISSCCPCLAVSGIAICRVSDGLSLLKAYQISCRKRGGLLVQGTVGRGQHVRDLVL
jgi:hypothetical protein